MTQPKVIGGTCERCSWWRVVRLPPNGAIEYYPAEAPFGSRVRAKQGDLGHCRRFPRWELMSRIHWCGEFRKDGVVLPQPEKEETP